VHQGNGLEEHELKRRLGTATYTTKILSLAMAADLGLVCSGSVEVDVRCYELQEDVPLQCCLPLPAASARPKRDALYEWESDQAEVEH
jgi:hypothetical protein